MGSRPLVLVHGYASNGDAFDAWRPVLRGAGHRDLRIVEYASRSDDVTLHDLAEGFERALRGRAGLGAGTPFDAIVHSTGMLVVRAWLAADPERRSRLKRLIGLAPATFGSPLAHKGRGMLGAVFNGERRLGPDFLEAGHRILRTLELGSPDTWDLAELDLLGDTTFYGADGDTPFAFVLCGADGYPFPLNVIHEPGSDGAVRLAGCALTTRRIILDLTRGVPPGARAVVGPWSHADVPVVPIEGCHHGSILHDPPRALRSLVLDALRVGDAADYAAWGARARRHGRRVVRARVGGDRALSWQQIVIRVLDERGEAVPDYYVEFLARCVDGTWRPIRDVAPTFAFDVHVHGGDPSFRCFHVDLASAALRDRAVGLRILAHSGTDLVGYRGYRQRLAVRDGRDDGGGWDGLIDLSGLRGGVRLFHPRTTTLVEIRLDCEPLPAHGPNRLVRVRGGRA